MTSGPVSMCWKAGPLRVRGLVAESLQFIHDDGCRHGIAIDEGVERGELIVRRGRLDVAEVVDDSSHVLCGERFLALPRPAPWAWRWNEDALDLPGDSGLIRVRRARGNAEVFLELAGEASAGNQPGVDVGEVLADSPELNRCRASD